jgi:hypothetical protein
MPTVTVNGYKWNYTIIGTSPNRASIGNNSAISGNAVEYNSTAPSGVVIIPLTLGGYTVTAIGSYAFSGFAGLKSITIPNTVTDIAFAAFENCTGLQSITIPNLVTSIGDTAFINCQGLKSLTIGTNVMSIGQQAFDGCSGLTSIMIPDTVTSIGFNAFQYCTALTALTIGNNVTSIVESTFNGCISLTSVVIGNSVTSIDIGAFYNCNSLTSIIIPDTVTFIGDFAFRFCSSLTSINIPNNVTSIGIDAFKSTSVNLKVAIIDNKFGFASPSTTPQTFFGGTDVDLVLPTPTMLITSPSFNTSSATNISPINLKFTSSKTTTNFINTDISFNDTTFPNTLSTTDNKVFTATFNPVQQRVYTISVPANKFTDGTSSNSASNIFTFTYDTVSPTMTIESPSVANNASTNVKPINLTFRSSQPTYNFFKEDISFNNGTFSYLLDGSGSVYTATITSPVQGVNTINVPVGAFTDYAGNSNTASAFTFTYDSGRPNMDISSTNVANGSITNISPITLKFISTESTIDFSNTDISFNNGTFSYPLDTIDNKVYNATITPVEGANTFYVPANKFFDSAGNGNTASNTFTFTFASLPPTMDISSTTIGVTNGSITNISPITLTFTSNKATTDFSNNDISFNNGIFSYQLDKSGDNKVYTATITNPFQGLNTFYVPAGAFIDSAGQYNTESNRFTFTFDSDPPNMDISSPDVANGLITNISPIELIFTSSKATTDFSNNDISFNNGIFSYPLFKSTDSKVYNATITTPIQGLNTIYVPAGAFEDSVGNSNTVATTFTFTFDNVSPSIIIESPDVDNGSTTNISPIDLTFSSTEPINDFIKEYIRFNNGDLTDFTPLAGGGYVYTAKFAPAQGLCRINVDANQFFDYAGNSNAASTEFTFTYDNVPLTMDITSTFAAGSITNVNPVALTFTSSKPIDGFIRDDISFNNGDLSELTTISNRVYTAIFTPTIQQGICTINVPFGAYNDAADGQSNTSATSFTFTFDSVPPTMIIESPNVDNGSLTKISPIALTFTSIEPITGFIKEGISFNNGTFSYPLDGSGSVYTATITTPVQGLNTINVPAGAFKDNAGNFNTDAAEFTFTFDSLPPSVDISSNIVNGSATNNTTIELTFKLSEPINDFKKDYITFANGTLTPLTKSTDTVYTATFAPQNQGLCTINVDANKFTDAVGNSNIASNIFTFTFDNSSPTMDISSNVANNAITKTSPIILTFTSSRATEDFDITDIIFNNGAFPYSLTKSDDSKIYTASFTPTDGVYTIDVPAGAFVDDVGNSNSASNTFTFTFDSDPPTMIIESSVANNATTKNSPIELTFISDEPINGFAESSITATNGTLSNFLPGSATFYTATFTPNEGVCTIQVRAGKFTDYAGNFNIASNTITFTFDNRSPTMSITSNVANNAITNIRVINLIFSSDESINGFTSEKIIFNDGDLTNFAGSGSSYTATFTPSGPGAYTIEVPVGAFADSVGNRNTAAAAFNWTFDNDSPTMDISSNIVNGSITNISPIELTFTSSKATTDFSNNDISFNNGAFPYSLTKSADNKVYNATIPTPIQGLNTIYVPAGAFTDSVGNSNTVATTFTFTFDSLPPNMDISSNVINGSTTNNASIELKFISTEAITGFTRDDISFNNGTLSEVTKSSDTVYVAIFSPLNQGLCTISVPVGAFNDYAGNSNTSASAFNFTFDSSSPGMDITSNILNNATTKTSPITLTFTSARATEDFDTTDIIFNNGAFPYSLDKISPTVYTASFNPTDGVYTIKVPAGAFVDALGNSNTASNTFTFTFDSGRPNIDITSPTVANNAMTKNSPIELIFTSTEATTTFLREDISYNNGDLSILNPISETVYTAIFSPYQGVCTISVPADKFTDAAGNMNNASNTFTFTFDSVRPRMDISANIANNAIAKNESIELTFTSDEPINGFVEGGIDITNGRLSNFQAISATVYKATFAPLNQGLCTINVDSNKFTDYFGNSNTASNTFIWTFDSRPPTMIITSSNVVNNATTNNTSIELTFTSDEPINGFLKEDIVVNKGSLSNFLARSRTVYTATFAPAQGVCTIIVGADKYSDDAGNSNTAATTFTFTFDNDSPIMDISSNITSGSTTNNASIELSFTSSRETDNFIRDDISFNKGILSVLNKISPRVYNATIAPTVQGEYTIYVPSGTFTDALGNNNIDSNTFTFTFDNERPRIDISSNVANNATTNNSLIELTFTSSKTTSNFIKEDISFNNGTLSDLSGSGSLYTATFTPTIQQGLCTINVDADKFTDAVGNSNTASNTITFTFDSVAPRMDITSPTVLTNATTKNSPITLTFTSSKATEDFDITDISFNNGDLSVLTKNSPTVYTAIFTPTIQQGVCTINVAAGAFNDAIGNSNTASNTFTFTFDSFPPTMTITSSNVANNATTKNSPIELTFTSPEPINGFGEDDISFNNGTLTNFIARSRTVYTATFTPTIQEGVCTINVGADKFSDDVGNSNTDATTFTFNFDSRRPKMEITSTFDAGSTTNNESIELTFTSSESTTNFVKEGISFDNGRLSNFRAINPTVYKATFNPDNQGRCTINVDANKYTDAVGNSNDATTFTFTFDNVRPTMEIKSPNVLNNAITKISPIPLTFTSSKATDDFDITDISFNKGDLSVLTKISDRVYNAIFSPAEGVCTIIVAAGAFNDSVGNSNTASNTFTFTFDSLPPTMIITSPTVETGLSTKNESIELIFTSDEPINGFAEGDINVTNGKLSNFLPSSTTIYTATFTPTDQALCTINVAANKFTDSAGNSNTAATTFTFTFDRTPPTMTITSPTVETGLSTNNSSIELTFTLSEPIIGFLRNDINFENGDLSDITPISETVYKAIFTPYQQGSYAINVDANKFTDAAGNSNSASNIFTFTFDNFPLTMTITSRTNGVTSGSITDDATIELTFTSTKSTNNFVVGDISVTNGALTNFAGIGTDGSIYTATFTPTGVGACTIDVLEGVFTDSAGNNNATATRFNWTFGRTVSFDMNTVSIVNSIGANATDIVLFVLPSGEEMSNINVTEFTGTGTITYDLSTDGGSVSSGTFTGTGTNLLGTNILFASTNTRYILTLAANASLTYTIVGTKRVNYGNVTPTALSFFNNILIIQNSIGSGDVDKVSFVVNAGSRLDSLEVTSLLNANSISYILDISGGSTVSSGSFTQAGFNLLNGNLLEPNTDTTYILTLTSGSNNTYSIVGTLQINQDFDKFCGRKKGNCTNVGYNKLVTSTNNPSTSNKMRYSQLLRTQRFKSVRTYGTQVPPISNERPLYLFATGQIFTR